MGLIQSIQAPATLTNKKKAKLQPHQVDGPVSESAWEIDGISGTVLYLKLVGDAIPAETPVEITVTVLCVP